MHLYNTPILCSAQQQKQSWLSGRHVHRAASRRPRRQVGDRGAAGVTIGLAAEAGEGGDGGDGAVEAAKRDLSQEEKIDEINKLVSVRAGGSCSNVVHRSMFLRDSSSI